MERFHHPCNAPLVRESICDRAQLDDDGELDSLMSRGAASLRNGPRYSYVGSGAREAD